MGAGGVECQAASGVELLQLQKATAGFGHLETQNQAGRQVKIGCRGAGRACAQCTTVRGSKARGGGCMHGTSCFLVFAAESPWDAFTVLSVCPAGLGLHSDSIATWSETLKITFKDKSWSMCTFLMQRLSPRGFGDCSTWSPGTERALPEAPGQSPVLLAAPAAGHSSLGAEPCWELHRGSASSTATPLCHSPASASGGSAHPQPFWAPALSLTPVLTLCWDCRQPPLEQGQKQGQMWDAPQRWSWSIILISEDKFNTK